MTWNWNCERTTGTIKGTGLEASQIRNFHLPCLIETNIRYHDAFTTIILPWISPFCSFLSHYCRNISADMVFQRYPFILFYCNLQLNPFNATGLFKNQVFLWLYHYSTVSFHVGRWHSGRAINWESRGTWFESGSLHCHISHHLHVVSLIYQFNVEWPRSVPPLYTREVTR